MPLKRPGCTQHPPTPLDIDQNAVDERLSELELAYSGRGNDLASLLKSKGVSRRDFLKWSSMMAAVLALPPAFDKSIARAATIAARTPVIWLHFQECTGCTETILRSSNPGIAEIILDFLSMDYHETIMAPSGHQAEKSLEDTMAKYKGKYLCIMEGSIPVKMDGKYLRLGPKGETALSLGKRVAADALAVIAVGHCASHGGPQSSAPNPTGATPVDKALGINPIKIPGCPYNGVNLVGVILNYLLFGALPTLVDGRPAFAYAKRIHDTCPRRAHFDSGEFVQQWGDQGAKEGFCLYKMGCKGPYTWNNCNEIQWNDAASFPIRAGHGCIGCSEVAFWDQMAPLEKPLSESTISIPLGAGIEGTADTIGWGLVGGAAAGIAGHAVYSAVVKKSRKTSDAAKGEEEKS